MTEWDKQEALNDLGLLEAHNYRSCAECGKPLIDVVFKEGPRKQFEMKKKVDDICVVCAVIEKRPTRRQSD